MFYYLANGSSLELFVFSLYLFIFDSDVFIFIVQGGFLLVVLKMAKSLLKRERDSKVWQKTRFYMDLYNPSLLGIPLVF